ncbi:hypothetical protein AB0H71_13990 [Nocardia sp. NPDC050697]|uniref:hypothetical protein n=1 Tax=Nocardia sp. NPDC050697 TaxID=3155158 RepID=UPI0033C8D454
MIGYTHLDVIKYMRFEMGWCIDSVTDSLFGAAPGEGGCDPDVAERLQSLREQMIAVAAPLTHDWGVYSDGRRVWSEVEIERGHGHIHVWHPDPAKNTERIVTGKLLADPGMEAGTYEVTVTPPQTLTVRTFPVVPRRLQVVPS